MWAITQDRLMHLLILGYNMLNESIETAKTGRDLRCIVKDLLGVAISELVTGKVLCSYGQTPGGVADTTNGGILLDASARENGENGKISEVIIREHMSSGTLQKPACQLLIFDYYNLTLASGATIDIGVVWKNLIAKIDIATGDWVDIDAYNSIACVSPIGKNIRVASDSVLLKAILVCKSTITYTANHSLQLEIRIERD